MQVMTHLRLKDSTIPGYTGYYANQTQEPSPVSPIANRVLGESTRYNEATKSSKRKKSSPHRSIAKPIDQVDRSFQRIVTLDVYKAFKENPSKLLGMNASMIESDSESQCSNPKPKRSTEAKSKPAMTITTACKVLPAFIIDKEPEDLDLDLFTDTKGAPSVHWKGICYS